MEKNQKDSMQNNGIIQDNECCKNQTNENMISSKNSISEISFSIIGDNNENNTIIYCPILLCDKEIDLDKVKVILEELKKIIQGESGNGLQA